MLGVDRTAILRPFDNDLACLEGNLISEDETGEKCFPYEQRSGHALPFQ
jgi:hypothetical protein